MKKYASKEEQKFIEKFARKYNEIFEKHSGGYVGWMNIDDMLKKFIKAYKRKFKGD